MLLRFPWKILNYCSLLLCYLPPWGTFVFLSLYSIVVVYRIVKNIIETPNFFRGSIVFFFIERPIVVTFGTISNACIDCIVTRQEHRYRVYDAKVHPQVLIRAKGDSGHNMAYVKVRFGGRIAPNRRVLMAEATRLFDKQNCSDPAEIAESE